MKAREATRIVKAGGVVRDIDGDDWELIGGEIAFVDPANHLDKPTPWDGPRLPRDLAPYEVVRPPKTEDKPRTYSGVATITFNAPAAKSAIVDTNPKSAFGATKPSLGLIPPAALLHEAMAFEQGAAKYGPFNWRKDHVSASTYVNAALRHLLDWQDGADVAADSGNHNLAHARACLAILIDAQECGTLVDDRPLPGKSEALSLRLQAQKKERAK